MALILTSEDPTMDHTPNSPDDEPSNSFYTPHPTPMPGGSVLSFITSQDSIDVYHDAYSMPCNNPLSGEKVRPYNKLVTPERRRHVSSGAKVENPQVAEEEIEESNERTCMLGPQLTRVRHSSYGHGSRSCTTSPFRNVTRISLSTNSLKRKLSEKIHINNSPHRALNGYIDKGESIGGQQVLPIENMGGESIKEIDEREKSDSPRDVNRERNTCDNSTQTPINVADQWMKNYVPCAELESFLYAETLSEGKQEERRILITDSEMGKITDSQINTQIYQIKKIKNDNDIGCCDRFRRQFSLSKFTLNHDAPHLFVISQWQRPNEMSCLYLAYRLFWAVYFLMWAIWSIVGFGGYDAPLSIKKFYMIFLTNWSIWLLVVDTTIQALNVILHMKKISQEGGAWYYRMPWRFKLSWAISNTMQTIHVFITIVFWILIFPYSNFPFSVVSVHTHIIPCCYVITDLFVSATPRRIVHAYLPMAYLTIYGLFSDIYYLVGGTNPQGNRVLYPILDWSKPSETLLVASGLVIILLPLIHTFIVCGFSWIRISVWRRFGRIRYLEKLCAEKYFENLEEQKV